MDDRVVDGKDRYAWELDSQLLEERYQTRTCKPLHHSKHKTDRNQEPRDEDGGHLAILISDLSVAHNPTILSSTPLTLMVSWVARWLLSESWMKFSVPPIDDEHEPQAPWYCT